MSRHVKKINDNIIVYYGNDHAIGNFLDICDKRYADSGQDEQGEGYVFEHSTMFPSDNTKVIIDVDEPITDDVIIKACNKFINTLKTKEDVQEMD